MTGLCLLGALWIGGLVPPPPEKDYVAFFADAPHAVLTKTLTVPAVSNASWRIVTPAMCDAFVNGTRITATTLVPWTDFKFRVMEDVYDVTPLLKAGENELRLELGNGWWNPLPMKMWYVESLRDNLAIGEPCVWAELTVTAKDGAKQTFGTDASWQAAGGRVIRNNVYLGEKYDARRPVTPEGAARVVKGPTGTVVGRDGFPRTVIYRSWTAKRVWRTVSGKWVVDFGENFAGNVRMTFRGLKAGAAVSALFGETLWPDGTVNGLTTVAGQMKNPKVDPPGIAYQRDLYLAKGAAEETYEPRFTFHGFRYMELDGLASEPCVGDFTALAYSADVKDAASFVCSDGRVNELREMCRRTFRSNLRSVQSDCPARERLGYGGDLAETAESFMLNYDMQAFYRKVLRDRLDGAKDCGGIIPYITPRTTPKPTLALFTMGWTIDVPVLTDLLIRYYGDLAILDETYPAMVRFIDRCEELFDTAHVPPCRFGDHEALEKTDNYNSALCHYHQFLTLTAKFARRLGRTSDAARFARMAGELEKAFAKLTSYVSNPGYVGHGRQSDQTFALYHDMLAPELREPAYQLLRKDVIAHEFALSTGFFSTHYLLEVLTAHGDAELAGRIVTHRGFPGWFHMMDRGATTLWETWAETDDIYSQNHPMFGSVAGWLMRGILGIRVADDAVGCDKVEIAPNAVAGITWAAGHLDTPKGRIRVSWRLVDGKLQVDSSVPAGVKVVNR